MLGIAITSLPKKCEKRAAARIKQIKKRLYKKEIMDKRDVYIISI